MYNVFLKYEIARFIREQFSYFTIIAMLFNCLSNFQCNGQDLQKATFTASRYVVHWKPVLQRPSENFIELTIKLSHLRFLQNAGIFRERG